MTEQQCNNQPKLKGVIFISKYMIKKHGLAGAFERMASGKKLGRPPRSLYIPPEGKDVNMLAVQEDNSVYQFKATLHAGAGAVLPITSVAPPVSYSFPISADLYERLQKANETGQYSFTISLKDQKK